MKKLALLFFTLALLLIPQIAFAQTVTIGGIEISIAVLTLIIFALIVIFMFVGVKFGGTKFPIGIILFALFIVLIFFLPWLTGVAFEVPSDWQVYPFPQIVIDVLSIIGFPSLWLYMPAFLYLILIPFSVIFIIVYAFLKEMNIFPTSKNIPRTLAFLITFLTVPFGFFAKFITVIFAVFIGLYAVGLFAAMFILGAFFMAYGGVRRKYSEADLVRSIDSDINDLNRQIAQLEKAVKTGEVSDVAKAEDALMKMRMRRDALRSQLREELR